MTPEQLDHITETIKQTIQEKVNGKIDRMNMKLDTYIKEDNDWKENVMPSIEIMKQMQGFSSTAIWIMKTIAVISTAVAAVWTFINYIKK